MRYGMADVYLQKCRDSIFAATCMLIGMSHIFRPNDGGERDKNDNVRIAKQYRLIFLLKIIFHNAMRYVRDGVKKSIKHDDGN